MSKPDLESRLSDVYLDVIGIGGGRLTFEQVERIAKLAAAIGDEIGYARGVAAGRAEAFEEAAELVESRIRYRVGTWQTTAAAIRALAAQRTDGEVG